MEEKKYTKLSDLVDSQFTVNKAWGYQFKRWDNDSKKMLTSDTYEQGFSKVYSLETDKGKLDLRAGQMGNLLEGCVKDGVSDINGRTFSVKSNGKTGIDIRYWINPVRGTTASTDSGRNSQAWVQTKEKFSKEDPELASLMATAPIDEEPIDMSDIPF